MIDYLFSIPLRLLAVLLNVWLMGFGLVGLWVVRRWVLPRLRLRFEDAYFSGVVVQSVMLLYGLIAALTAVGVWQRYTQAAEVVSGEATAIANFVAGPGRLPAGPAGRDERSASRLHGVSHQRGLAKATPW